MARQNRKVARLESAPPAGGSPSVTKRNNPDTGGGGLTPTEGNVTQQRLTEASRPTGKNGGGGKKRNDRRDTNPTYTGNAKHAARGNTPRKDVSTRAR